MGKSHPHGVESTAAVFHHPIHPMAIAFPVATLMAAPLTDLAARATGDPFWRRAGRWLLLGGLTSGLAASAIGLIDYLAIREVRRLPSAHVHAAGNALAMLLAAANLARRPGTTAGLRTRSASASRSPPWPCWAARRGSAANFPTAMAWASSPTTALPRRRAWPASSHARLDGG